MRVNIDEIKEAGLDRHWDVTRESPDAIVQGDRSGWRARGAAHVDLRLERLDRRVLVRGSAVPACQSSGSTRKAKGSAGPDFSGWASV
jgi:hypothetical protein